MTLLIEQFRLLADYNRWMNRQLYQVASQLTPEQLAQPRGAFFGSIIGSFNHIVVGDLIWLRRFAYQHPTPFIALQQALQSFPIPTRLDEILYDDFSMLSTLHAQLETVLEQWINTLTEDDLAQPLTYANMKGVVSTKHFSHLLIHLLTHQVHHRGQITTLLSQAGLDFGETDLLLTLPNLPPASV